jgi:hypothetical protein
MFYQPPQREQRNNVREKHDYSHVYGSFLRVSHGQVSIPGDWLYGVFVVGGHNVDSHDKWADHY